MTLQKMTVMKLGAYATNHNGVLWFSLCDLIHVYLTLYNYFTPVTLVVDGPQCHFYKNMCFIVDYFV